MTLNGALAVKGSHSITQSTSRTSPLGRGRHPVSRPSAGTPQVRAEAERPHPTIGGTSARRWNRGIPRAAMIAAAFVASSACDSPTEPGSLLASPGENQLFGDLNAYRAVSSNSPNFGSITQSRERRVHR